MSSLHVFPPCLPSMSSLHVFPSCLPLLPLSLLSSGDLERVWEEGWAAENRLRERGGPPPPPPPHPPSQASARASPGLVGHVGATGPPKKYSGDFWLQFDAKMVPNMEPRGSMLKKLELSWRAGARPPDRLRGDPKNHNFSTLTSDLSRELLFKRFRATNKNKGRTQPQKGCQKGRSC